MRKFRISMALMCAMTLLLFSCQPENVKPKNNNAPGLEAEENPHPLPDPICSAFDTVQLYSTTGSFNVDFCGPNPCPSTTADWGILEMLNGEDLMILNFSMAIGWFIEESKSEVGLNSDFTMSTTSGAPMIETDWETNSLTVMRNKWQLLYNIPDLPGNSFALSVRLTVVKRSFFGGVVAGSQRTLWTYNNDWDDPESPLFSSSPYLTGWTLGSCIPGTSTSTVGSCDRCDSENTVTYTTCSSVDISSCKSLSNIVVVYTDCTWEKFENYSNGDYTDTIVPAGIHLGKNISHVYVKSGCNKSGEGHGFGRRFNSPCFDVNCIEGN